MIFVFLNILFEDWSDTVDAKRSFGVPVGVVYCSWRLHTDVVVVADGVFPVVAVIVESVVPAIVVDDFQ